jgi:hypothetical protein
MSEGHVSFLSAQRLALQNFKFLSIVRKNIPKNKRMTSSPKG